MFDIAFTELLVIGLVALVVIGPERLPKVARTVGGWLGKLNRYAQQVKDDVNREIKLEELRKMQDEMKATAQKYEILAAEAEVNLKRELIPGEKLAMALGVTDGPVAQLAKDAAAGITVTSEPEPETPHAVIEYADPNRDWSVDYEGLPDFAPESDEFYSSTDVAEDAQIPPPAKTAAPVVSTAASAPSANTPPEQQTSLF